MVKTATNAERFLELMIRFAMFVSFFPMIYYSATFSATGLAMDTGNEWMYTFGIFIAGAIVILEFAFNRGYGKKSLTIMLFSLLAYAYSISTTFVGIRGPITLEIIKAEPGLTLIYFIIAAGLDILPEVFLIIALFGEDGLQSSDMIRQFVDLVGGAFTKWASQNKTTTTRRRTTRKKTTTNTPQRLVDSRYAELQQKLNGGNNK